MSVSTVNYLKLTRRGGNERRSELYQFMNPKFNQNIRDLEEEND